MKAAIYERYGSPDVLRMTEIPTPSPQDNEILIRTRATTVSSGDWRMRSLDVPFGFKLISRLVFGILKPRQPILGMELAGVVEEVGKDVTRFKPGDEVFAFDGARMGCHAEFKCMPEDGAIAPKPGNLTWEEAAALSFGGTTALDFFRRGKLKSGERVLVNGASGAVGTAAVQLARHFGARVTGVCGSANLELVKSLGAERVIDYTKEDFAKTGGTWDVIVDTAGTASFSKSRGALAEGGRLLVVLGGLPDLLRAPWVALSGTKRVVAGPASGKPEDVRLLGELAVAGKFKPVIDRTYAFERIVEAHRRVDSGRKRGNVVVTVSAIARGVASGDARELASAERRTRPEAQQRRFERVTISSSSVRLRAADASDAEFIYRLVEATMRGYVEQIWGSFSEDYNRKNIADSLAAGIYSVIGLDGEDIGALAVERLPTHIQLTQMYVLPSHQNRGIGTSLVRALAREAKASGRPLRLRVLSVNPARRLYEREGFRVTSVTPERVFMELPV